MYISAKSEPFLPGVTGVRIPRNYVFSDLSTRTGSTINLKEMPKNVPSRTIEGAILPFGTARSWPASHISRIAVFDIQIDHFLSPSWPEILRNHSIKMTLKLENLIKKPHWKKWAWCYVFRLIDPWYNVSLLMIFSSRWDNNLIIFRLILCLAWLENMVVGRFIVRKKKSSSSVTQRIQGGNIE